MISIIKMRILKLNEFKVFVKKKKKKNHNNHPDTPTQEKASPSSLETWIHFTLLNFLGWR